MGTVNQTINAKARIWPNATAVNNVAATVREIAGLLEIEWDGLSFTNESEYLLSAKGNAEMLGQRGEGVATAFDFELDNTNGRFLPENSSSPIQELLTLKKRMRFSIIVADLNTYRLFTGYIKEITPDRRNGTVNIRCLDNSEKLNQVRAPRTPYTEVYSGDLARILAEAGGLTNDEIDIARGQHLIRAAWFDNEYIWPILSDLAVAERGRVFFDEFGRLKFQDRNAIKTQSAVFDITRDDFSLNLGYNITDERLKNRVVVEAKPRASSGIQVVWTNGPSDILDQYNETLIWIPAGETQFAWIELEDPATAWITPVANTDYTANTVNDGSGSDITSSISIKEFTTYGNAAFIAVHNSNASDAYLTEFNVRANPLRVFKWIRVDIQEGPSIEEFGERTIEIKNDYIDDEAQAQAIANEELKRWNSTKNIPSATILGVPYVRVGDIVRLEVSDSVYESFMISKMDTTFDDGGFIQELSFVPPYSYPTERTISAKASIAT